MFDVNLIILLIFSLLFVVQTYRHRHFNWLWLCVVLWLVLGFLSASVLPSVLGITHLTNFYLLHGYIFAGSIFFFLNDMQKLSKRGMTWQTPRAGNFLTLLAITGLVMHLAFLLLVAMVWWLYPSGQSAMLSARLMLLYAFQPMYWWGVQAFLMLLFVLHRKINGDALYVWSLPQLEAGILLAIIWQFLYLLDAHRWLPYLLHEWLRAA